MLLVMKQKHSSKSYYLLFDETVDLMEIRVLRVTQKYSLKTISKS